MIALKRAMGPVTYRALGAAVLDRSVYEGIEHDPAATRQALLVVIGSSLAAGIGASGWSGPRPLSLVAVAALSLVSWLAWALIIQQIGGRYLAESETHVDLRELLRTIGFAASPGFLQVFAWIPSVTTSVFIVSWVWMFAAMTVAVRQALDFRSLGRALAVCGLALGLVLAMAIIFGLLFGPAAAWSASFSRT
jgi:hypothetical protein